jgi:hypothetical protein
MLTDRPTERPIRADRWLAAALLLAAAQGVLLARTAWDKSDTVDEPYYLATAVLQWTQADFHACDAPALPKWGFAAALRLADPRLFDAVLTTGRDPLASRPIQTARRNLFAGRLATILVCVAGGWLLFLAARSFGDLAGFVSHALWAFSPSLLANGSLATLDAWAASLAGLGLWATLRFASRPSRVRAAVVGAALALAAACKVTTLGLVPVAAAVGAWALVSQARREGRRSWGALGSTALVTALAFLLTLFAVYGGGFGVVETSSPCGKPTELPSHSFGPLPFSPWLEGLLLQVRHGSKGHLTYLFGQTSGDGWWWFYLACLALKTTLGAQALTLLTVAALLRERRIREAWLVNAAILAYPALLLAAMSAGHAQNGIRYILPAFPFAMLWAGRAAEVVRLGFGRRGVLAVAAALALGTAESLAVHPHHLMFFNLWAGGPEGGPRYLIHGDDWGQDQRRLGVWQQEQRPWRLYYTYYNGDPRKWGVTYEEPPCSPQPGYYALHAVEVHRPKRIAAGCLDWLTQEPPDARLGYSIYLYQVNRERIARLERERRTQAPFWGSGGSTP